jgi:hypothetical protein
MDLDSGIHLFSRLAFSGRQPPLSYDNPVIGQGTKHFSAQAPPPNGFAL